MRLPYQTVAHASTVACWMIRIAADRRHTRWLLEDPHRFASFYAALTPYLKWPAILGQTMAGARGLQSGTLDVDPVAFEAWRKERDYPFTEAISAVFLERFFEGILVHGKLRQQPQLWEEAVATMAEGVDPDHEPTQGQVRDSSFMAPSAGVSMFAANNSVLKTFTRFSDHEEQILELAFLLREDEGVRLFFDLANQRQSRWIGFLSAMLAATREEVEALTAPNGTLMKSGLVSIDIYSQRVFPLSDFWHGWFSTVYADMGEMFAKLVGPLVKKPNAGALGRVHPDDWGIITDLLKMPRSRADAKEDMNVLLYGPRSIDKIGYVADRLAAEDLKAFTLADGIPERDRGAVCYFVQRYLAQVDPNAILVLPAADTILTRTRRGTKDMLFFRLEMDDEVEDTEADVVLLAKNPIKTVWLVNGAQRLSEDNLGRFLYSAEVRTASRAERKQEIETLLKDLDVGPELHQELSQHLRLSEQQITSASRLVEEMETIEGTRSWAPDGIARGSREYRASLVRRAIEQSQKAMDRRGREVLRQPITTYSLDLLHTSGAFSVQQILQSLKHRPAASLCFYGLPGTGKTQLAEHIAVTLDKPILAKRASDLMDKYVGGSEKLIREMFNEATEEDAVLFLDEADSFLTDRSRARQSYETSIVNEVLQGMERFPGVFICATNLFSRLDKAALRRFTFKVEFLELTEPQRWQMFLNETGIDEATVNPNLLQTWRGELEGTQMLTPGDFATLQRQCKLLGTELTPEQWLMGLAQEAKHKRDAIEAEGGQILR